MGEVIATTQIKREQGYLYYVKSDENGNLVMCRAVLMRGGGKKKKK